MGKGSGGGGGQPAHTTQTTTSEYPTELKPFIKDIFGKAKGIEEARTTAGYQAYPAPRIAGFTPDQQAAFTGIREAQGLSSPFFGGATSLIQRSARDFTPELSQQYMSPYAQNVIDIEQRELGRRGDVERQRIGAQAVGAGGYGGSRHAILEAEQARQQGQRASDIQTKGLQSAFQASQQAIAQQRAADLAGAQQMAALGTAVPGQRFKELGALAGLGAAEQTQQQRALDLGYKQFRDEYNYPMQTLQDYSSVLRGFPLAPTQTQTGIAYSPVAPLSSQLLGAGTGALGMAGMAGMFGASGGHVSKLQQGGLASMYNRPSNRVQFGKTNYQNVERRADGSIIFPDPDYPSFTDTQTDWAATIAGEISPEPDEDLYRGIDTTPSLVESILGFKELEPSTVGLENVRKFIVESSPEVLEGYADVEKLRDNPAFDEFWKQREKRQTKIGEEEKLVKEKKKIEDEKIAKDTAKLKKAQATRDAADAKRIEGKERIAKWAPWLAGARGIAESETPLGALLGVGETYGKSQLSVDAARDAETARRAGIRSAAIDSAETLSKVYKNLAGTDRLVAVTALRSSTLNTPEQNKIYDAEIAELLQDTSDKDLELIRRQIRGSIDPNLITSLIDKATPVAGDIATAAIKKAGTNKTGGRVKLKKGGTPPIRSFDFVERDGKIIAIPT